MTIEEAKKVAEIIGECDGGCVTCVKDLVKEANKKFPKFEWSYKEEGRYESRVVVKAKSS